MTSEKRKNPKLELEISLDDINKSLPEGFLLDKDGYDDHNVSLFYRNKRIVIFNATKIVVEKINDKIKEFRKNKHKHKR